MANPLQQGFILKRGDRVKSWKRRFMVLSKPLPDEPPVVEYFKTEAKLAKESLGTFILDAQCSVTSDSPQAKISFSVVTPLRTYQFRVESEHDYDLWTTTLQRQLDMLQRTPLTTPRASMLAPREHRDSIVSAKPIRESQLISLSPEPLIRLSTGALEGSEALAEVRLIKQGFLHKVGGHRKNWKRRWFVLHDNRLLQYFRSEESSNRAALGQIHLNAKLTIHLEEELPTLHGARTFAFSLITSSRKYIFDASSLDERQSWVDAIACTIGLAPDVALAAQTPLQKAALAAASQGIDGFLFDHQTSVSEYASKARFSGYLEKIGKQKTNKWKRRWFLLFDTQLCYYKTAEAKEPLGTIYLTPRVTVADVASSRKPYLFDVSTANRTYYLHASTDVERSQWIEMLLTTIQALPRGAEEDRWSDIDSDEEDVDEGEEEDVRSVLSAFTSLSTMSGPVNRSAVSGYAGPVYGGNLPQQTMQGYLYKTGPDRKNWKKRWFMLRAGKLTYYRTMESTTSLGFIDLNMANSVARMPHPERPHVFEIQTTNRAFTIAAQSAEELERWVGLLISVLDEWRSIRDTSGPPMTLAPTSLTARRGSLSVSNTRDPTPVTTTTPASDCDSDDEYWTSLDNPSAMVNAELARDSRIRESRGTSAIVHEGRVTASRLPSMTQEVACLVHTLWSCRVACGEQIAMPIDEQLFGLHEMLRPSHHVDRLFPFQANLLPPRLQKAVAAPVYGLVDSAANSSLLDVDVPSTLVNILPPLIPVVEHSVI